MAVEQDFPSFSLNPLDQETANQDAFAETRCKVYIRPAEIFTKLHQQVESSQVPLVLTGDSGMGKSALLANWAKEYQLLHPEAFVLIHFIGSTAQSTSHIAIQRRIMAELKRRFQMDRELPRDPKEINKSFVEWLYQAGQQGKVVLILDAIKPA